MAKRGRHRNWLCLVALLRKTILFACFALTISISVEEDEEMTEVEDQCEGSREIEGCYSRQGGRSASST